MSSPFKVVNNKYSAVIEVENTELTEEEFNKITTSHKDSTASPAHLFLDLCYYAYINESLEWENSAFKISRESLDSKDFKITLKSKNFFVDILWNTYVIAPLPINIKNFSLEKKAILLDLKNELESWDFVLNTIIVDKDFITFYPEIGYFQEYKKRSGQNNFPRIPTSTIYDSSLFGKDTMSEIMFPLGLAGIASVLSIALNKNKQNNLSAKYIPESETVVLQKEIITLVEQVNE